ncbi:DUF6434 domain-containing protein [Tomitella biformata]|uniref:DUF6434 domain-containing protein n=1 Tax=Tomitella biformata TaxID=630403 RepID=UPI000467CB9D|nr:DUF6434 domain-containing protein [Tomitella biformata]
MPSHSVSPSDRPALRAELTAAEFSRWYWTKAELLSFARAAGLRTSGRKAELANRIAADLDGREPSIPLTVRPKSSRQLAPPLAPATAIPPGQRCSQVVRAWFTEHVDPHFHFDAAMREFFAAADGTSTLADAAAHWRATRDAPAPEIGAQFELNRFTRQWHLDNPGSNRADLMEAWRTYRALPIDERGRA